MRVRNIVVSDKDLFEENLVRDLIALEISYVQIEDEFHFDDNIYRFYSTKDLEQIKKIKASKVPLIFYGEPSYLPVNLIDIANIFFQRQDSLPGVELYYPKETIEKTNRKKYNKQMIKIQNREINNRLKNAKR